MTPTDPATGGHPLDAIGDRPRLTKVLISTVAVQIAIVMASLCVPVLASLIAPAAGIPAYLVGYYSALIYGFAATTSFATPLLLRRWGGIAILFLDRAADFVASVRSRKRRAQLGIGGVGARQQRAGAGGG